MKHLRGPEHDLITLARALVGHAPSLGPAPEAEAVGALLRAARPAPDGLGRAAMGLLQDTLARGGVLALVRRGGHCARRHLAPGGITSGRLWERHAPIALRFSPATFELLAWLVAAPIAEAPPPTFTARTNGDELVAYLACELLVATKLGAVIARVPMFTRSPLCWLRFFDRMTGLRPPEAAAFTELASGERAVVLEALQTDLARRWEAIERRKPAIERAADLIALGQAQEAAGAALLAGVDLAGRWDLAFFVAEAVSRTHDLTALVGALGESSLAERGEARRAAGAARSLVEHMERWVETWRATPFFEDGFATTQVLLASWEALGDAGVARADARLRELATLAPRMNG